MPSIPATRSLRCGAAVAAFAAAALGLAACSSSSSAPAAATSSAAASSPAAAAAADHLRAQGGEHRLPLVRGGQQLRRPDAGGRAGGRVGRRRDAEGLRRGQQPADAVRPAADRHQLRPVQRHHHPADREHRPGLAGPAGDRQGDQGRQHGPDPRLEPEHGRPAGHGPVGQRDVRADDDRHPARPAGGRRVRVQEAEPVQGRLPVRHQGVLARHRHLRRVHRRHQGQPGLRSSPTASPTSPPPSA